MSDRKDKYHKNRDNRHRPYDPANRGSRDSRDSRGGARGSDSPKSDGSGHSRGSHHSRSSHHSRDSGHSRGSGQNSGGSGHGSGHGNGGSGPSNRGHNGSRSNNGDRRPSASGPKGKKDRRPKFDIMKRNPLEATPGHKTVQDNLQQVRLVSNHFDLSIRDWKIYQYSVSFEPECDLRRMKTALLYSVMPTPRAKLFDGSVLRTNEPLDDKLMDLKVTSREGTEYTIKIKFTKEEDYLTAGYHQVLNTLMRQVLERLQLQQVGRNFYDAKNAGPEIRRQLQIWPGYLTSIRQHDGGLFMNVEFLNKVMRTETVHSILNNIIQGRHRDWKETFSKEIIGSTVLTDYNNKTYKIVDVNYDQNPLSTFDTKDGPKSYVDYYRTRYQIHIRDTNQPMLMAKSGERQRGKKDELIALIPELCRPTGLTEQMKRDFGLKREMDQQTRPSPSQRVNQLHSFCNRILNQKESIQVLRDWQLNINDQLVSFKGRRLPAEKIEFGQNASENYDRDWMQCFRNHTMFNGPGIANWCFLYPSRNRREALDFLDRSLRRCIKGFQISDPYSIEFEERDLYRAMQNAVHQDPQIILVMIPSQNAAHYAVVKKFACLERAIPTQVLCFRTLQKNAMSVATKVVVQMNAKLGYAPWKIAIPLRDLMICGYDISKEGRDIFGAFVASMDERENPGKYFSVARRIESSENTSDCMELFMIEALRNFADANNGNMPSKILFYRDGVSEGQLETLINYEVEPLTQKLKQIYEAKGMTSRFAYVIVNKKVNTRILQEGGRGYENPAPGTVVDNTITFPERYDFFLVPQEARQGTVSPTAYNVVEDTLGLPPAKMQIMTYKLCHNYFNWNGKVRVPAVCQYAKKLAGLCTSTLKQEPNNGFQNKLYFL